MVTYGGTSDGISDDTRSSRLFLLLCACQNPLAAPTDPLDGVSFHAAVEVRHVVVPRHIVKAVLLHAEVAAAHRDAADGVLYALRPEVRVQHLSNRGEWGARVEIASSKPG